MARYLGLVSSDLRGKIGGVVGTRATSGTTLRTRVAGTQPRSTTQAATRHNFGYLASAWRAQGSQVQAAWASLASLSTLTNSLGVQYTPTGQQLFLSCNQGYYAQRGTINTDPPATVPAVPVVTSLALEIVSGALLFTATAPTTGYYPAIKVSVSPPMSYGQRYRHRGGTRFLLFYFASSGQQDITAEYVSVFGALPGPCYTKLYALPVDNPSGYPGTPASGIFALG